MRFAVSCVAGVVGAWVWRRSSGQDAECYRGIQNALTFHNPDRKGRVFSQRYEPYQLGEIIPITADVALFRFLLHHSEDEFNLRPCSTLQACYKYGVQPKDQCQRFYTPVTANHTAGYFDLIVKRKKDGLMTNHLFGMHVGDTLLFRSVAFKIQYRPNRWKHVGMIGGGTGFTPFLQIIRHALTEPVDSKEADRTKLSFLFCNRTERHILLGGVFDDLARRYPHRFRMFYTIDLAVDKGKWLEQENHFLGYVTTDMIRRSMPAPEEKNKIIMLCGPDPLLSHVAGTPMSTMSSMSGSLNIQPMATDINNLVSLGGLLKELGYDNTDVYRF
ncbi:reductase [Leishmania donovani]|uniref:Reductase_-_putative n=3 Tax=Leishmania donovani species complex TaxID=38574 RepID=A0A6L0XHX0_LEIIN|nr:putative reductase [Leishmania infantum JPCM5]XP_003861914.1 reductase, putative [Leishmania donovani]CAC9499112.1 reductase_-_putative [Leishmania infantum]AYU79953.1 reductase, putative [Leishmania donovani]TPP46119.1 Oxidoreductase NAD-binding domain family protein [Leishmania donovani]TPP47579.1 Oxidoreductase NAD-binding domain family protein [Leishmania donovani]CAJ1989937.1 reductase [Leishmania donovani]|eukprot:XP_003392645.1 putative reductase [Leishmania infantum JPCM5]